MDDYYRLLGVSPDASRDEIKGAYRARREALGPSEEAEAARLNRAWNVLSDRVQRERYDAGLASAGAGGEQEAAGTDGPAERPRRGLFGGPARGSAASRPVPSIEMPPGTRFAATRARMFAMLLDLTVIILVGILVYLGSMALVRNQYPGETGALERLADRIEEADERAAEAGDRADEAEAAAEVAEEEGDDLAVAEARADVEEASAEQDAAEAEAERAEDEARGVQRDLGAALYLPIVAPFVAGLVYLVVPSALTGQTLGKRLRGIRVIRLDGSAPGLSASTVRYGLPVLVVAFLWVGLALGPLAIMVTLLGVLMWLRSPNQQGLHDRVAKTVVVAADWPGAAPTRSG